VLHHATEGDNTKDLRGSGSKRRTPVPSMVPSKIKWQKQIMAIKINLELKRREAWAKKAIAVKRSYELENVD
jgi:hypothetical protein